MKNFFDLFSTLTFSFFLKYFTTFWNLLYLYTFTLLHFWNFYLLTFCAQNSQTHQTQNPHTHRRQNPQNQYTRAKRINSHTKHWHVYEQLRNSTHRSRNAKMCTKSFETLHFFILYIPCTSIKIFPTMGVDKRFGKIPLVLACVLARCRYSAKTYVQGPNFANALVFEVLLLNFVFWRGGNKHERGISCVSSRCLALPCVSLRLLAFRRVAWDFFAFWRFFAFPGASFANGKGCPMFLSNSRSGAECNCAGEDRCEQGISDVSYIFPALRAVSPRFLVFFRVSTHCLWFLNVLAVLCVFSWFFWKCSRMSSLLSNFVFWFGIFMTQTKTSMHNSYPAFFCVSLGCQMLPSVSLRFLVFRSVVWHCGGSECFHLLLLLLEQGCHFFVSRGHGDGRQQGRMSGEVLEAPRKGVSGIQGRDMWGTLSTRQQAPATREIKIHNLGIWGRRRH